MCPERVVLPAPAISQTLSLGSRGEQLGVEELIPEASIERFRKTVLPRKSRLDGGRCRAVGPAPTPQRVSNELEAVVRSDECRCRLEAGEFLQHGHQVPGLSAPSHPDRQAHAAVLVDHVQEFEPAAVGRGIELEVHGPNLVGMLSPVTPLVVIGGPCPLLLSGSRPLKALLPPDPLHPLVIHTPALAPQHAVGHPPAPADVLGGDLPQSLSVYEVAASRHNSSNN